MDILFRTFTRYIPSRLFSKSFLGNFIFLCIKVCIAMLPAPSNLDIINSKFQKSCIPLLNEFTSSTTVLCDFPSKLQLTSPHVKIFGIDNLFQFLEASLSPLVQDIVILSQQSSILKNFSSLPNLFPNLSFISLGYLVHFLLN